MKSRGWSEFVPASSKVELLTYARFNGLGAKVSDDMEPDELREVIRTGKKPKKRKK